ncbi:hypothetical protein GOP47_0024048 [Adiantum capillus-veneris]|uniref:Uncharacterized protein n=1 Tax=Adiantum capillus-veneris TaxID=13818 RepID=A0A9D4U4X0_ADICA|nr:hypothetical protein GOP47_0024048 [Adiantum capillus-veneris]
MHERKSITNDNDWAGEEQTISLDEVKELVPLPNVGCMSCFILIEQLRGSDSSVFLALKASLDVAFRLLFQVSSQKDKSFTNTSQLGLPLAAKELS